MDQNKKEMKQNITRSALCAVAFIIVGTLIGPAMEIPYGQSIFMAVAAGLLLYFNRKQLPAKWAMEKKMPLANFLVALGIFGGYHALMGSSSYAMDMFSDTASIVCMGLITPITEEIIFRGIALNRLKKHGILFGLVAASVLFGVYHLNVIQLVTGALLGLLLGYVAMNYSIVYSIILHVFNNLIMAICLSKMCDTTGIPLLKVYVGLFFFAVGVICAIKIRAWEKVRQFINDNRNKSEEGCYKAFFLNPVVIMLLFAAVAFTIYIVVASSLGVFTL